MGSRNLFQEATDFLDDHIREIKYLSYGLGAVGAVIVLRSTYAFRKFHAVKDVPENFIRLHAKFHGTVKEVDSHGCLLIDHTPIISVNRLTNQGAGNGYLPVSLAGVTPLPTGVSWLREHIQEKHVWFKVLRVGGGSQVFLDHPVGAGDDRHEVHDSASSQTLACIVTARKNILRRMCVNEELIGRGLATVVHIDGLHGDRDVINLTQRLVRAELKAERKGYGMWQRPSLVTQMLALPAQLKDKLFNLFRWKRKRR